MEEVKMRSTRTRKWKRIILYVTGIVLILLFAGVIILNKIVQNAVKERLSQLSPVAIISYSSMKANFFASSLSIHDLAIRLQPDTADHSHQHILNFSKCEFIGIDFLKVVFHKKLFINDLQLVNGNIRLDQFLFDKTKMLQNELSTRMPLEKVSINRFSVSEGNIWLNTNGENKLLLKANINLDKIEINKPGKSSAGSFHFGAIQCTAKDIQYAVPNTDYTFQIKQLLLNSKQQMLKFDSLKIMNAGSKPASNVVAFFRAIKISGMDIMQLQNEIRADSIIITRSTIAFGNLSNAVKGNKENFDSLPVKNISVNHFVIEKSTISSASGDIHHVEADKIAIDSLHKAVNKDVAFSSLECHLSNIRYSVPYRSIHINKVMANSKNAYLRVDNLSIATRYPKYELGKKLGHQADYIEAVVPVIEISKLNFKKLIDKKLVADRMTLSDSKIYFFRDRRLPRPMKEQPMPNDYIQEIPMEVRVNTFKINNASVVSEEMPKDGNETGFLKINNINISMSPMLNHPTKHDPSYSDTYVEGSIMGAGQIAANIHAPLKKNVYQIKGFIKNLDLSKLNPSAENLGRFHVESGMLNFLDFHFVATEEKATGEIIGEYHNLLIDRLKQKNGEKRVAKIPTFLLKHVIIPKNKDRKLDIKERTGKIDYKRDPTRMVSFYLLKSLLDGIRSSFNLGFVLPK